MQLKSSLKACLMLIFEKNRLIADAVVRNIEIIGEASKNIPTEIQRLFTDILGKN